MISSARTRILVDNVSLEFPIYDWSQRSIRRSILKSAVGGRFAVDSRNHMAVKALESVSLELKEGDRIALLGHNGAGKSVLLRTLAGIYQPTLGTVQSTGSINTLFDIFLGFDQDASGARNIYRRGYILGLDRNEINSLYPEVADFSDLGAYLNMPMRNYSAGMSLRLAFAIATSIHRDILLMDEWISVGDANFVKKAEKRLLDVTQRSKILVFASHSEDLLRKICSTGLLLHHGRVAAYGKIDDVIKTYQELNQELNIEVAAS